MTPSKLRLLRLRIGDPWIKTVDTWLFHLTGCLKYSAGEMAAILAPTAALRRDQAQRLGAQDRLGLTVTHAHAENRAFVQDLPVFTQSQVWSCRLLPLYNCLLVVRVGFEPNLHNCELLCTECEFDKGLKETWAWSNCEA